ncbi:MAG: response regulator transcription factor [Colwellia sp.]|jgi:Response regulators consisting of a CheY-like receiver domain and a winged-helix DNA-binding domain
MKKNNLVFIVDDDQDICKLVRSELEHYGMSVRVFFTGTQARRALKNTQPAVCIIDLGLPDMDGLGLVKQLCDRPDIGVLILSGRGNLPDRVLGLELGADDYITKPFALRELVARVHSLVRRVTRVSDPQLTTCTKRAQFDDWSYNPSTMTLTGTAGESVTLSSAEADLLYTLLSAPQQVLSRELLLREQTIPYDRSIDSRMSRLRKKIESNPKAPRIIKTIYGAGYMLATEVRWDERYTGPLNDQS